MLVRHSLHDERILGSAIKGTVCTFSRIAIACMELNYHVTPAES